YHVQGVPGSFWSIHEQPEATKIGDSVNFGDVGYENNRNYRLTIELEPDRFRLWYQGTLEIDAAGTFTDGRLALYNRGMDRAQYRDWLAFGQIIEEGGATPDSVIPFTDPGLLDTHGGATVEMDGVIEGAAHLALPGVVGVTVTGRTFEDDLLSDGVACVTDDVEPGCNPIHIRVRNVAPIVSLPGVLASGTSTIALDGATFTDPGLLDTHAGTVDWGDGSPPAAATLTFTAGAGTVDASHDYAADGTYTVTACVVDDDGGEGCAAISVTVTGVSSGLTPTVKSAPSPTDGGGDGPQPDRPPGRLEGTAAPPFE
ncbi:MAG: PKD domain-containing protein, partial [Acidobacteriota bacterium]